MPKAKKEKPLDRQVATTYTYSNMALTGCRMQGNRIQKNGTLMTLIWR